MNSVVVQPYISFFGLQEVLVTRPSFLALILYVNGGIGFFQLVEVVRDEAVIFLGRGGAANCDALLHGMRYRGGGGMSIFIFVGPCRESVSVKGRPTCSQSDHSLNVFQVILNRDERRIKLPHCPRTAEIS